MDPAQLAKLAASGGQMPSVEEMQQQQAAQTAHAEMRVNILSQILLPAAADRLKRLQLVRPDKVRAVEDSLLMAAKSGKLKEKVSEEQLIQFLGQLDGAVDADGVSKAGKTVKVQRRKYAGDDESDDNDDDLL